MVMPPFGLTPVPTFLPKTPPAPTQQVNLALPASALNDAPPEYMSGEHLISPVEASKTGQHLVPVDRVLDTPLLGHWAIGTQKRLVELPVAMQKSMKGDKSFDFSELMLLSKFPFYVGGASMIALFSAGGGSKHPMINMGVAVAGYMASLTLADRWVKQLYHWATGLDLNQLFRRNDGKIGPMFASPSFPRTDLMSDKSYMALGKRMGLQNTNLTETKNRVQGTVKAMIGESRILSMLLGYTMAAVGAGYIAKNPAWGALSNVCSPLFNKGQGHVGQRLGTFTENVLSKTGTALKASVALPAAGAALNQKLATGLAFTAVTAANLGVLAFASTFIERNSPKALNNSKNSPPSSAPLPVVPQQAYLMPYIGVPTPAPLAPTFAPLPRNVATPVQPENTQAPAPTAGRPLV
jgi:hypothetical protein